VSVEAPLSAAGSPVYFPYRMTRVAEVTDGLSNTAFGSESLLGSGGADTIPNTPGSFSPNSADILFLNAAWQGTATALINPARATRGWAADAQETSPTRRKASGARSRAASAGWGAGPAWAPADRATPDLRVPRGPFGRPGGATA
jgi:hypothetical protein